MSKSIREELVRVSGTRLMVREAFNSELAYRLNRYKMPKGTQFPAAFRNNYECEARLCALDAAMRMAQSILQTGNVDQVEDLMVEAGVRFIPPTFSRVNPRIKLHPATALLDGDEDYDFKLSESMTAALKHDPFEVPDSDDGVDDEGGIDVELETVLKIDGQEVWVEPAEVEPEVAVEHFCDWERLASQVAA